MKEFEQILEQENLKGWKVIISTGGALCMHSKKTIFLSPRQGMAMFLHEVAHALISKKVNKEMNDITGHHSIWGDKFTALVKKYMIAIN